MRVRWCKTPRRTGRRPTLIIATFYRFYGAAAPGIVCHSRSNRVQTVDTSLFDRFHVQTSRRATLEHLEIRNATFAA
jgi:hypothetical protein